MAIDEHARIDAPTRPSAPAGGASDRDGANGAGALRDRAVRRLKRRHDLHTHLLVYALVNGFLAVIWALTGAHGFFWPLFPIAGWGIAVALNVWHVLRPNEPNEERIRREVERLSRRHRRAA